MPIMGVMPKYKCHKEVWALKIKKIDRKRPTIAELEVILKEDSNAKIDAAIITPEESGYAEFGVDNDFLLKHDPQPGGYFVVYEDGYKSYSPAQAFENGYTRIES